MTIEELIEAIAAEAAACELGVDTAVYQAAGRDPLQPILYAGRLDAPVAFLARDLGRDEVMLGEPLIGSAGRRVRCALHRCIHGTEPPASDRFLHSAVCRAMLTNTVPYKPVDNKAYAGSIRERFRPYIAELLCCHWHGDRIIPLGREAFFWFGPFAGREAIESFWERDDRFEAELTCDLRGICDGQQVTRPIILAPLPHPSPMNQANYARFPELLRRRLD